MKTFAALIRRYVLATAAIVLLVGGLLVGQIFYVGFKSNAVDATGYRVGALADALKQTETGLQWGREHTPAEWMQGYAWAMVLDDNGNVIWQQDLPQKLNHRYTASEVAVFSHWYLADYPVQCWAADYGLFVVAEPVGTCWKYNIDMKQKMIMMLGKSIQPTMVELLLVVLGCCLFFSWRGSKSLQTVTAGLDTLAQGGTVSLPAAGFAGELAQKLNETSEQLRRRNEIIARRDDARTSWIAGVSHDVRTPLALMQAQLELFSAEHPDVRPETVEFLTLQREQTERLTQMTRTLLEMSNLVSVPRSDHIELAPLLDEILADLTPLAQKNGISLGAQCDDISIVGSDALIYRLLFNLIENGIKYNTPGGSVHITIRQKKSSAVLRVADTGCGIPEEYRTSVFQPFFRVDKSRSREMGGVGLGLALVREIALLHGGTVTAEPADGHGTVFTVTLPIQA